MRGARGAPVRRPSTRNPAASPLGWSLRAQYALALGVIALALAFRWVLDPVLSGGLQYVTSFAALLVLALLVRPGPFVAAAVVACAGTLVLFIEPRFTLTATDPGELVQLAVFGFACAAAATAGWLSHRAEERRERADDLIRQTESALARRSEEIRLVTDAVPALISYVDAHGCYRFVNKAYVDWFGREPAEIVGRHMADVLGEAAFARIRPHVEAALSGQRHSYEEAMPYAHGGPRDIRAEYVPDVGPDGVVAGFYGLVTDISERRRADRAQARLAAIVEASADAILSTTLDGVILSWNAGAEKVFGYTAAEAIGQPLDLIVPHEQRRVERGIADRLRSGESIQHYETVRVAKDGRRLDVSVSVSPLHDASGRLVGVSKVARDITGRKEAERARKDADRRKDEFLALLSHELRNPLAAVRSAVEILLRRTNDLPAGLERLPAVMQRQVSVMVRLIDDLLDVSRITRGKLELRRERVGLAALLRGAVDIARPWLERAGHELAMAMPAQPVFVDGDPIRLTQVFTNVLSNACKHANPGGRVEIRLGREGADAVVHIRDRGFGIRADDLETVFEMFTQLERPERTPEPGLGVGLALARRIVELHGGSMRAESDGPGHGSTFVVRLPALATPPPPDDAAREGARAASASARRVLVVDDNRDAADTLATLLAQQGHTTETAYDGRQALGITPAFRPHAILLDVGMPGMDGLAVCRAIRAQPWGRDVFVVAVTGWGQERDRSLAAEAGFDAHLTKPADPAQLQRLLASSGRGADG